MRKLCQAFLAELDEDMVLLLGMMADASDEVLTLVRLFDREAFAIEQMAERVQTFKHTLNALFHGGGCLRTGFTRLCLQHLQTQKVVSDGKGVRGVGGPTVDLSPEGPVVRGCLQRMVAWCKVVQEVAATEFPDWELLGAFAPAGGAAGAGQARAAPAADAHRPCDSGLPPPARERLPC